MINNKFIGDEVKVRESLKKYCERDTWGMVVLWQELKKSKSGFNETCP